MPLPRPPHAQGHQAVRLIRQSAYRRHLLYYFLYVTIVAREVGFLRGLQCCLAVKKEPNGSMRQPAARACMARRRRSRGTAHCG
jgi:hypothetical protein